MFEQSILADGARRSNPWSFAASVTVQSVLVAAALVLPVMHIAKIDTKPPDILFLPRQLGTPEVKKIVSRSPASSPLTILQVGRTYRPFRSPSRISTHVATGPDLPGAPEYDGSGSNGVANGVDIPGLTALGSSTPLPAPPPEPPHKAPQPVAQQVAIRVGKGVQAAKLVFGPKPVYPPLAKQARISGSVRLAAQISADGRIEGLRVVTGHPMLVPAAIEAVRQWIYKPTLLNGQPVEVLTDIEVNFVLNQ